MTQETETRLDRIERILEEHINNSEQDRQEFRRLATKITNAMTDLIKLHTLSYDGPWESETAVASD